MSSPLAQMQSFPQKRKALWKTFWRRFCRVYKVDAGLKSAERVWMQGG